MPTDQFFTSTNIISVGVATVAVTSATNTLYALLKAPQKITAFATAMVIAYVAVAVGSQPQWYEWVLAFFNGCLLFCGATGMNELGAAAVAPPGKGMARREPILKSWFTPKGD